jgi:hypothetical protein
MPPSVFPTGVTIYDPEKAYNCYVLFDGRDDRGHLIDMNGNVVKSYPYSGWPIEMIDPAEHDGKKGHVLGQKEPDAFNNENVIEMNWDGNIVWEWGTDAPGGKAGQDHDLARLPNGNTLILGYFPRVVPEISDEPVRDQNIYEVTPQGELVWQWSAIDHREQLGIAPEDIGLLLDPKVRNRRTGLLALNNMHPLGPNKWHRAGDERFHPDNLMIDSRDGNFIAIVAKSTGDIVWLTGPSYPGSQDMSKRKFTGAVPRPLDQTCGQHDAHLIPDGCPGAGNILLFDNGGYSGWPPVYHFLWQATRILEIDPNTRDIVWQYDASSSGDQVWTFFSYFMGGVRRLPNGNTLICETIHGRIFQVTPEGEIVWEYVCPIFVGPERKEGEDVNLVTWMHQGKRNWMYRAQPIPYDWVPEGTGRSENEVLAPDNASYRVNG